MPLTYMNMKKIVLSFFALAALNCSAQSVSQRLERLFDADQQIRKTETVDSLIEAQDSVNRAVLKEFIADYNPDSCSVKANQGLYLVLSHSPLAFRLPMAHLIEQAWQKKRLDAFYYASFQDGIRYDQLEPQIYGTQFMEMNGKTYLWPVADVDKLDERRAALGLPTEQAYIDELSKRHPEWNYTWDRTLTIENILNAQ